MAGYARTVLPMGVTVQTVVSVHHFVFENARGNGEAHDFPELIYVEKGSHDLMLDGTYFELHAGELMIYAPCAFHEGVHPSNAVVGIVSFEAESEKLPQLFNRIIPLTARQRALLTQIITAGKDIFQRRSTTPDTGGWLPRADADIYELQQLKNLLELLLLDLLACTEPKTGKAAASNQDNYMQEQFDALTQYLQAHLDSNLTLEQISADCAVSVSRLKRLCRECCGQSPMAYFTALKIREAKRMIRETPLNFTQIAQALGFGSVHYFSRCFREKTGQTPSDYARSVLKQE